MCNFFTTCLFYPVFFFVSVVLLSLCAFLPCQSLYLVCLFTLSAFLPLPFSSDIPFFLDIPFALVFTRLDLPDVTFLPDVIFQLESTALPFVMVR